MVGDNPTYCLPLLGLGGELKQSLTTGGVKGEVSQCNSGGVEGLESEGHSSRSTTIPEGKQVFESEPNFKTSVSSSHHRG